MTDSTATHCPTCGAPIREDASKFCAFCGTKLPEPVFPIDVVVKPVTPKARDRIQAALAHPALPELMAYTPPVPPHSAGLEVGPLIFRLGAALACLAGLALIGLGLLTMVGLDHAGKDPWPGALLLAFGIFALLAGSVLAFVGLRWKPAANRALPEIVRALAFVSGERSETSGGQYSTSTRYFVTLEFADGQRREYPVTGPFAGTVEIQDVGVAYVRNTTLLDFRRLDA